jgi:hypothetical protein
LFKPVVQVLLNIKQILSKNSTKSKKNIKTNLEQALGYCWKGLLTSGFHGGDFVGF